MVVAKNRILLVATAIAALLFFQPAAAEIEIPVAESTEGESAPEGVPATRQRTTLASWEVRDGYAELNAFVQAFPDRVYGPELRNGQWAIRVDDTWFGWAQARLLPIALSDRWEEYQSIRFYRYPLGLPPLRTFSSDVAESLKKRLSDQEENPPERHEQFLATLYRAADRRETESRLVSVEFLGYRLRVHEVAAQPLERVEQKILDRVRDDREVGEFFQGIRTIQGYHWRDIAGTGSRSYHSYGMAIDLLPRSFYRKPVYWRWAMESGYDEWWAIPYKDRWMVPMPVVQAFEAEGFIWGGKWLFFDAMHFEYRPEIMILANRYPFEP